MKTDEIDAKILDVLMKDGRASYRQIANRTNLSTPTVSARLARMIKSGMIRKFVPVLSTDSLDRGLATLVVVKVDSPSAAEVANHLAKLSEVQSVYTTTGQLIILKVSLETVQELQPFLAEHVPKEAQIISSEIITGTIKEEKLAPTIPRVLTMDLRCDYCKGSVTSSRPYTISSHFSRYYFCCKTCRKAYIAKNGRKLSMKTPLPA